MTTSTDQTRAPKSKAASQPKSKDDLKSVPMAEVEKSVGLVS